MTVGTEAKNAVSCPRCGAEPGEVCTSRTGGVVSNSHKARIMLWHESQQNVPYAVMGFAPDPTEVKGLREVMGAKAARVDQVLWGINFARKVLKLDQETIDRNLAIMIVDEEMDLKLF
jgi:hypothetical protein